MIKITEKDILDALGLGHSPEEIAQSFTDMLNSAIETKRKDEEELARILKKENDLRKILSEISEYFKEFYPDIYDEKLFAADVEDVIKILDKAYLETQRFSRGWGESIPTTMPTTKKDPIAEFLSKHNL